MMINKERIHCPQEEKRCCSYKISKLGMAWHRMWFELLRQKGFVNNIIDIVNPHFFLEILYISDICMYYVYWITYILDHGGQIASPVLWSANLLPLLLLLLFLLLTTTTSTPTDQPTSPAYYYFYCFYYIFNCYYNSYWAPIGLPSPRSHRPSFLLSSHYIVPCTSYRWSITSCHHCIV